ncbi:MAG TPA: ABC transporter permease [Polyangiaceae bacterium]|nr:ABC transporter permease [Polyangiaceae bacterium]
MAAPAAAVALVVASGVALFVATMTTYRSLRLSEASFYETQRFAQVWSGLSRAPRSLVRDLVRLPGVQALDARIVVQGILDVPGVVAPCSATVISVSDAASHGLNGLYVRNGRRLEAGRSGEVLVSEGFAEKNRLRPGDSLFLVISGRRVKLTIAGVALSPEYVMQVPPGGQSPEERRFAILWMARDELESLADLRDAFNDLALRLSHRAQEATVIREVDRRLEPYGGQGAYGRSSQSSHVMLEEHVEQLKSLAVLVPSLFLLVAAFLVNVVLGRIVATERQQVGTLKAFGYSNGRVALHYLQFALSLSASGVALGVPIGAWLGHSMAVFYATFFRFPVLVFRLEGWIVAVAGFVAVAAAASGALGALRRVVAMPPSVAMSAAVPVFSRSIVDTLGVRRLLSPVGRMIFRSVSRRPGRALLTSAGMSLAIAIVVLGSSSADGIRRMEDVQFQVAQREDLTVTLSQKRAGGTFRAFASLPGVRRIEPSRVVRGRVGAFGAFQDVMVVGLPAGGTLRRAAGNHYEIAQPVPDAALITKWLAEKFDLRRGDPLTIEVREGGRRNVTTRIAGFVDEPLGESIYMELEGLDRLLAEPRTYSVLNLLIDPQRERELYALLKRTPEAAAVHARRDVLANFRTMTEKTLTFIRQIEILFSVIIAFGVVYNVARIALAERGRELATLRVLGFKRAEIWTVLVGEIALLAVPAIPLGLGIGYVLSSAVASAMSSERMHLPLIVETSTYASAIVVFLGAAVASALLVRPQLDALDLVSVLKARE